MAPEITYDVLGVKSDDLGLEVIRQFVAPDPLFFSVDNRPLNDLAQRDVDLSAEIRTSGVFVAKIGGSTPDYAGTAIRTALSDFKASGRDFALFIVREDMIFSGGNLTVTKPFKMVAQVEVTDVKTYDFAFNGTDVLTLDTEATVDPGFVGAEFVGINVTRGAAGTGGIVFPKGSLLRLKLSDIFDQATGPTVDFIRFTGPGIIELETSRLFPSTAQDLISGTSLTVICRRCHIDIATSGGEALSASVVTLHLLESTFYRTDDFTSVTTLRVFLDGTSILVGDTQVPTGFATLEVAGHDFYTPRFALFGISLSDALNFNISGQVHLASTVFFLTSTILTISRSDLQVSGTRTGSEGTRIEGAPSAVGNSLLLLTGNRIRLQGIVFRSSPSVASHATAMIRGVTSPAEGLEIIDCEFQAEGSNDTGSAVELGLTGSVAADRNLIRTCWARSSPDGVAAFFRSSAVLSISGSGLIENCIVENFLISGLLANSSSNNPINTGGRISTCIVDMSSCTEVNAIGISMNGGSLSDCRVRCPTLASSIDTAEAIRVSSTASGEGTVVSNCRISGLGTSSTRRIGIGISVIDSGRCKVSGCSIRDFRKQGIKIVGDLNIVVHNVIESINDGTDSPAIEAVTGADNNLVDANLESGTSGYVDGGATNHFDTANTDNTGNKTI